MAPNTMIFKVNVFEESKPENFFNSELEADDFTMAIRRVTFDLIEIHQQSANKHPAILVVVLLQPDPIMETRAWRLDCSTKEYMPIEVPCGECLGTGGVDSGGVTPQESPINLPCPSCQETHEHANFSQTVCAVCSGQHDLKDLIGTCPQCREAKTVLDAWQEAFGTSQLTHALAENQEYGKALTRFQNDTWASLNRYSDTLGWGLSGMQPECWTLLDAAIEELLVKRKLIHDLREVLTVPDRCTDQMVLDAASLLKDMYVASQAPRRGTGTEGAK